MSDVLAQLKAHLDKDPQIAENVFVAPGAVVIGDVVLKKNSSVWFNAVLRGDLARIEVGEHTSVQDNVVMHIANDGPCIVGNHVTIGHSAVIHACTVGDECLIGMGAVILDGAVIGKQSIVGAGALVTQGSVFPEGSMILGSPAKLTRPLTAEERTWIKSLADKYTEVSAYYRSKAVK